MKKAIIIYFVLLTFLLNVTTKALADCQPIYGGGQTCTGSNQLNLTKTVLNPGTNQMIPNLGINDPKYHPNDLITFQIKTINNTSNTISMTIVKDTFPPSVLFSDGPGNFDKTTNTLNITSKNLNAGQTSTYTILGRIANSAASGCMSNQASASSDNIPTVNATSQFCIEGKQRSILGAGTQTNRSPNSFSHPTLPILQQSPISRNPPTGLPTEMLLLLLTSGVLGLSLRNFSIRR